MSKHLPLLMASLVVGLTFLFSGAVKLNDPLGFTYKIEEYLQILAGQLTGYLRLLLPYTLTLAMFNVLFVFFVNNKIFNYEQNQPLIQID